MAHRIVVDPLTRIEGHLRIEVEVSNGEVKNAWSTGTLFRGLEVILQGRDPRDAWLYTQRLCGVCTYVHGLASVRCVDSALEITVPKNARIIRNLLMGAQFIHDHIVHFYHLHALDWVDLLSALEADPYKTDDPSYFAEVQKRLETFVNGGQLGPFANAYWGHPAYQLTPEMNLVAAAHYLEALRQQARTARMHAVFGGKNPHPQSLVVGGVTCAMDLNEDRIAQFREFLKETQDFIDKVYIPDVRAIAGTYADWAKYGATTSFLSYGEFPQNEREPESLLFPRGVIFDRDLQEVESVDLSLIAEHVKRSWYEGEAALHPSEGETKPKYTGLNTQERYSWLKAPRYDGEAMEVGPLARVLVAYGRGHQPTVVAVDDLLTQLDLPVDALFSTLGRTAARALETKIIADAMEAWVEELEQNVKNGNRDVYQPYEMLDEAFGAGLNEAPRGALGHWIRIHDQKIANYQMVVPSTWNLGPRCFAGKLGPVEEALIGTPVADPERPVEILRTVHSFDPCIACAVHVIDTRNNKVYEIKVNP